MTGNDGMVSSGGAMLGCVAAFRRPLSPSYFSGVQIAELSQNVEAGSECAVGTEVGALVEQL